ncbi:hypothetical protein ASG52_05730 [Methylobacterium sp. Leaf456]|uniref:sulfotransferase family 2 domain-containing protein n=1 Tax=Methylobacterium sp. Leaf456 TaxID=1736382 RepID=UPI0006F369C6|nr:sulfotransferase family 2 domain-containing protein [Methylobacterium sp. Leaf456]KQT53611.1 hypothetical protein ASG52_05730 [Methylobacterium sp. Leaf456]
MTPPIVFVHVPKCAGTSLRQGIAAAIGEDRIFLDYDNNPANPASAHRIDPEGSARRFADGAAALLGRRIAYGHLHPAKYRAVWPEARWMTVLRDPIDRLISHYFFWKQDAGFASHPIRDYVLRHELSLIDFARLPFSRFFLHRTYFGGLQLQDFSFVGRAEDFAGIAGAIGDVLETTVPVLAVNAGRMRGEARSQEEIERARPALAELLADEIAFYRQWTA